MLKIFVNIYLFCIVLHISMLPSELLGPFKRKLFTMGVNPYLQKVLTCPYCISIYLGLTAIYYFNAYTDIYLVFATFVLTYFTTKFIK